MQRPRIYLTAFAADNHTHNLFLSALQKHSAQPHAESGPFVQISSLAFDYEYLFADSLRTSSELLFWFGERLHGALLLVDAEDGLTAPLREIVALSVLLKVPLAGVILIFRDEPEEWLSLVEGELRSSLSAESIDADSLRFMRWNFHEPDHVQEIFDSLDAIFSSSLPLELKPLQIEFFPKSGSLHVFSGVYWQGSVVLGARYQLLSANGSQEVTLQDVSEERPVLGAKIVCQFAEANVMDAFSHRMLSARPAARTKEQRILFCQNSGRLPGWSELPDLLYQSCDWDLYQYRYPNDPAEFSVNHQSLQWRWPGQIKARLPELWTCDIKIRQSFVDEARGFFLMRESRSPFRLKQGYGVGAFIEVV